TDYNGGYVFPAALSLKNTVIARRNNSNIINLAVTSLPDRVSADTGELEQYRRLAWGSYQLGVAYELKHSGYDICGCDLLYHGTVPYGAGLSSSASIEVASAVALAVLGGRDEFDMPGIAVLCQKAENEYAGMNCGIMDQFISAMGKAGHALLLNCRTLEYQYVPVDLGRNKIVITNSNKPRKLIESKYNERRMECAKALEYMNKAGGNFQYLCDMTPAEFGKLKENIPDGVLIRRAQHAVNENERTLKAVEELKRGDIKAFGEKLNESHISLRDDYEVTGIELDTLFEEASKIEGNLGTRMTGAGFGGCTISIVNEAAVEEFKARLSRNYYEKTGYEPSFYVTEIGEGAHEVII
ncbi:MAG TPA: galactokinase, partial [Ruminiclostridium sp.]|nr:galactokinase [Ruminiclostridium sp.]